jgi:selenocysteine lyase/cysteine desulfurase
MKNQRAKFSLPKGTTYLNCAYMSPLMKQVEAAGVRGLRRKRNPMGVSAEDFFTETEALRKAYARLIHVSDPKRIVVIPSASYGLSTVARNVKLSKGDHVVVMSQQFPSNMYPWMRLVNESGATLKVISPPDELRDRGKNWNRRLLEAITSSTRLVAMGHVHWADGTRFELEDVSKRAREVGAKLIIDGTQSVGALPFDVSRIKPDALVCAGYKWLMGPYSMGLAYFGEGFDEGVPLEENWINRLGSEDFTGLVKYEDRYQPGALRYEVGEHSNFILVPMMREAVDQVNRWGPENIQVYCGKIIRTGLNQLRESGFWIEEEDFRGNHLFGLRFPEGTRMEKIRERVKKRKISVSFRGDSMRISPHVYNSSEDFQRLVDAIR